MNFIIYYYLMEDIVIMEAIMNIITIGHIIIEFVMEIGIIIIIIIMVIIRGCIIIILYFIVIIIIVIYSYFNNSINYFTIFAITLHFN
jgi:hypothetical protein